MPHSESLSPLPRLGLPLALDAAWSRRGPDVGLVETGMARTLDAIRTYARIAWWDGSAVGLRLHGFVGLFDLDDAEGNPAQADAR